MFGDILDFFRSIDWSGYHISIFEVLLVIFALMKKFNTLSALILIIVLGRGFVEVLRNTDFDGTMADTVPFYFFCLCGIVFFVYAMAKLFSDE